MIRKILLFQLLVLSTGLLAQDKKSTASENVHIIESPFEIPVLHRGRTVRLYLPPGYENSTKSYPVLYMHDGQNLFDDATSFVGEWGVDEAMDELAAEGKLELIVVGIDNGGGDRIHELTSWDHPKYGKAEGKEYMDFIVNVVKPYIDKHYRTRPERESTAIMGSSLGGLVSHYAIYNYPTLFSKAGIFSPSYWYSEMVFTETKDKPVPKDARLYLLVGGKEGESMVPPYERMVKLIQNTGHPSENLKTILNPEGEHNEKFWREEFKEAVLWLFRK